MKKLIIGTGLAAAAGYLAGLLTAPKAGKETRKDIKDAAKKGAQQAETELKDLQAELTKLSGEAKRRGNDLSGKASAEMDDLLDKARTAKDKARDVLTAVRGGGAEDRELQRAVAEASKAVTHLRKFLKK